ncbi:NAD(P)-dependent oxidoreductase [Alsobacter sp. KACC 23698]|uniref:NAD(P)-dependent oxidoreductase n=1 Tax=Alsobacter sp. KACC 23698 TaxID=3149229 RepID=A0AAU7JIM0_9HYPH
MKLLITGATGFLGRHVVATALAQGHSVRILIRPSARLDKTPWAKAVAVHRADLRSPHDLQPAFQDVDAVIHLAASVAGNEDTQFASTVVGTENLLSAMALSTVRRIVLASSFSVYDWSAVGRDLDEESSVQAAPGLYERDVYTIAKVWQERVARRFAEEHGFALLVLRPGFIWGPGGEAFAGLGVRIGSVQVVVGPASRLALTYVENCAQCFVLAAERVDIAHGTFNVVDAQRISSWRYAAEYARWTNKRGFRIPVPYGFARTIVGAVGLANRAFFGGKAKVPSLLATRRFQSRFKAVRVDGTRTHAGLGWAEPVDLAEGLRRTFRRDERTGGRSRLLAEAKPGHR